MIQTGLTKFVLKDKILAKWYTEMHAMWFVATLEVVIEESMLTIDL